MVVLALGMAVVVAPLTTMVMGLVETQHAGVASGGNNAVARIAGLVGIGGFGLLLRGTFDKAGYRTVMIYAAGMAAVAPVRAASFRQRRAARGLNTGDGSASL